MNGGTTDKLVPMKVEDSLALKRTILHCAGRCVSRMEFLREVSEALLDLSGCDATEIRLAEGGLHYRWRLARRPEKRTWFETVNWTISDDGQAIPVFRDKSDLERFCGQVASNDTDPTMACFTTNGSFLVDDAWEPMVQCLPADKHIGDEAPCIGGHYRSVAVIRFIVDKKTVGLLHMKSERPGFFTKESILAYEAIAQTVGLAVADWQSKTALRERVKELTCLYGIAQVVESPALSLREILQEVVNLLPASWQFPEIAAARIQLDGHSYITPHFRSSPLCQSTPLVVGGSCRGVLEVVYLEDRPEFSVVTFLPEEEKLILAVAREISHIAERIEAQAERSQLQGQLIHADRLATIGQLAAGVAHELNEPLGSILGFAQLIEKCADLPSQAEEDLKRIVKASLHAREIIRKLLVFARQTLTDVVPVDLNHIIEDGLYFLEARCAKAGIEVVRDLAPDLPEISADPVKLNQLLVNLVVNAVQAMPDGGTLTLRTSSSGDAVLLVVEDSGIGICDEIADRIFLPFFTTKDVDEGTGLGLSVVHGIVMSHGGSIDFENRPEGGTRFTVHLSLESQVAKDAGEDGKLDGE